MWFRGTVVQSSIIATTIALSASPPARAIEFLIESETQGDAYQLLTSGNEVLNRRRLHQYLGLAAWDMTGDGSQALSVRTMFRFDGDFGLSDEVVTDTSLRRDHLSIQYAYLEGKDLFGGWLDFRLGRQLEADPLDFMMIDGLSLSVGTPWHIEVGFDAGLEVKDDLFALNANALETDGARLVAGDPAGCEDAYTACVSGGSAEATCRARRDQCTKLYDAVVQQTEDADSNSYAIGAYIATRDLNYAQYRVGYRRIFSNLAVDSEKVGGAFRQRLVEGLDLSGLASWDLFNGRFDRIQATARWRLTDFTEIEVDYTRLLPSFDADAIWNIFTAFAQNDLNLRWRLFPTDCDRIYAAGMARLFGNEGYTDGALTGDVDTVVAAWGVNAGWLHTFGPRGRDGRVSLDASYESGYGGDRLFADVSGTWAIVPREWELEGRLTALDFEDELQPNLHGFSFGYQVGGRYLIDTKAAFAIVAEHNMNRIHNHQLRVFALVDLALWL